MLKRVGKIILLSALVFTLSAITFYSYIYRNTENPTNIVDIENAKESNSILLIDFYGDGCKPCRMISPSIEEIAKEYTNVKVMKVDINGYDGLHKEYGINFIPTVIIFSDGKEFVRLVGYHEKEEYTKYLDALIIPDENNMVKFEINK